MENVCHNTIMIAMQGCNIIPQPPDCENGEWKLTISVFTKDFVALNAFLPITVLVLPNGESHYTKKLLKRHQMQLFAKRKDLSNFISKEVFCMVVYAGLYI